MRVRFWGTRGSLAKPGPSTIRYGGNTSCVEVRSTAGTLVVIDCGTGAHQLGQMLVETEPRPIHGHMLISHTHWDHIQGWPFFAPLFVPGNEWDVYAPRTLGQSLRETLAGQMQYTYFPVSLEQLGATIRYHDLVEGVLRVGDITVTTQYLNHPTLTLGYRLEADGVVVVYSCDHEPFSRDLATGAGTPDHDDRRHIDFLAGADLVIHDAQYTADEYQDKIGWGHSTAEYAAEIACAAGVKAMALTHHDPLRDDDAVDAVVQRIRTRLQGKKNAPRVFAAAEGPVLELEPGLARTEPSGDQFSALTAVSPNLFRYSVLMGISDPDLAGFLTEITNAEGVHVRLEADPEAVIQATVSDEPSLIVLQHRPPEIDGLAICRTIRAHPGSYAAEVPIALVASQEDAAGGNAAGVTAWLVPPFSQIYARSRLRTAVLRHPPS